MSLSTRQTGLGTDPLSQREKNASADARRLAMRAIEVRFAAALVESAMPKSASTFGKGVSGSIARENLANQMAQILSNSDAIGVARAAELRDAGVTGARPPRGIENAKSK